MSTGNSSPSNHTNDTDPGSKPAAKGPLVSVIITVYNRPNILPAAVQSVLKQTCTDYEIIIVDDGSDDGTTPGVISALVEEVQALKGPDSAQSFFMKHSGRPGRPRNYGALHARGKYIALLDSDDLWLPPKLAQQAEFLELHPKLPLVHTRERWLRLDADGRVREVSQRGQKQRRAGDIFADALHKCIIGPSTVMLHKEVFWDIGGFREDLEIAEDYEFWLRLTACYPVGYLDTPLIEKRAGFCDQLSEKYGHIEIFRIRALADLVKNWFPVGTPPIGTSAPRNVSSAAASPPGAVTNW